MHHRTIRAWDFGGFLIVEIQEGDWTSTLHTEDTPCAREELRKQGVKIRLYPHLPTIVRRNIRQRDRCRTESN